MLMLMLTYINININILILKRHIFGAKRLFGRYFQLLSFAKTG